MFERFLATYAVTTPGPSDGSDELGGPLGELVSRFGGSTFGHGVYRVHTAKSASVADAWVTAAFPELAGSVACFGFDWLGRQFSLDSERGSPADPEVLMLEPGTGDALEIPVPFSAFHDDELVDHGDAALATRFFSSWHSGSGEPLAFAQCAGYRVPLFLGGDDTTENLEVTDLDVYWSLTGQLRLATRNLAPGTAIGEVRAED